MHTKPYWKAVQKTISGTALPHRCIAAPEAAAAKRALKLDTADTVLRQPPQGLPCTKGSLPSLPEQKNLPTSQTLLLFWNLLHSSTNHFAHQANALSFAAIIQKERLCQSIAALLLHKASETVSMERLPFEFYQWKKRIRYSTNA